MAEDDSDLPDWLQRYPPADITPGQFEVWVAEVLASVGPELYDLRVEVHDRVTGFDGSYDFDATARYRWAGLDFLALVEAKRHANPIKRELVQALYSKVQRRRRSQGRDDLNGALSARGPGVREGARDCTRFGDGGTFFVRNPGSHPSTGLVPRASLRAIRFADIRGFCYGPGDTPDSTGVTLISTEYPDYIRELLLAVPTRELSE
jgi:restriction endonuclease